MLAVWVGTDALMGFAACGQAVRANPVDCGGVESSGMPRRSDRLADPIASNIVRHKASASARAPSGSVFTIVSNKHVMSLHTLAVLHG